jgi:hypothetical protein
MPPTVVGETRFWRGVPAASNFIANTRRQKESPGVGNVLLLGSEAYLHRCLEHARTTDAVDIAYATAQCAGDLAEVRSKSSVW